MFSGNVSEAVSAGTDKARKGAICKALLILFYLSFSSQFPLCPPCLLARSLHLVYLVHPGEAAVPQVGRPVCSSRLKRAQSAHWICAHPGGWLPRLPRAGLEAREKKEGGKCGF